MKTFTRISSVLALALAVCWGSMKAQQTCDAPLTITCGETVFNSTTGVPNDNTTSGAGLCVTAVGTMGQIWYSFTAPADGAITATTMLGGSDYDTKIHVYTGSCGSLVCETGNDDSGGTLQSLVNWDAIGGTTYLIRVGGFTDAEGSFEFNLSCDLVTDGCTDPAACNFEPEAINDDGSCCLENCLTLEMTDSFGDGWNGHVFQLTDVETGTVVASATLPAGTSEGTEIFCVPDGCYFITWIDGAFDGEVGWLLTGADEGDITGGANPVGLVVSLNSTCIPGCMDIFATNYNPGATIDDGSCVYCAGGEQAFTLEMTDTFGDGWNGATFFVLDEGGNIVLEGGLDDGTGGSFVGCLAAGCFTFNITAGTFPEEIGWTLFDGSGNAVLSGTAPNGAPVNVGFAWAGQTGCIIPGCTDEDCNNYNPFATEDDGSCICPPDNDDCDDAAAIGCGQTVNGSTLNANMDGMTSCNDANPITSPGVWYTFVGTGEQVTLSTCSGPAADTRIHVFTGDCVTPVCVSDIDDGCAGGGFLSTITFSTINGLNYNVLISEFGAGAGIDFVLEMNCTDCPNIPINDECENALPLPEGVPFPGNLCCSNSDPDMAPWAGFGTQYGIWYVVNSEDFDAIDLEFWNGSGEGDDAGDGTDVGIGVFEGVDGCDELTPLVGGIGFDGNPLDGFIFNSFEFGIPLVPNTDYYILLTTSDPVGCGDFVVTVDMAYVGCTDALADNYDPEATIDDGSCAYTLPPANDLCADAQVLVCGETVPGTTGLSTNTGAPTVCPVGAGDQGVWYTFTGDGQFAEVSTCGSPIDSRVTIVSSANGCAGPFTCVASEDDDPSDLGCGFFDGDDASVGFISEVGTEYYVYVTAGAVDTDGDFVDDLFDGPFEITLTCEPVVEGCQDECACDFNPDANVDSGDCDYFSCEGCGAGETAVQMQMIDTFGDGWNGNTYSIEDLDGNVVAEGDVDGAECGDGATEGFDVFCLANGCYNIVVGGGAFPGEVQWTLVDSDGNTILNGGVTPGLSFTIGGGVCGCTDEGACNFDPAATTDNGSCEYDSCSGCTDEAACNFDPDAIIPDPEACCFDNCVGAILNDSFGDGWNGATLSIVDALTGNIVGTAGMPTGSNATASFCLPTGCYTVIAGGGTFDGEISWTLTGVTGGVLNGFANDPDGVGFSVGGANCVPACTEPMACNYDPTAGISDCSLCDYSSCQGCTYEMATNYDPAALIDDGSCIIPEGNSTCPYDFNDDNIVGVADLIEFIQAYGSICPN